MVSLIIGGAASGKSEFAENHVLSLSGDRIYLACMEPFGENAAARIQRHRLLRQDKGFTTLELYRDFKAADPALLRDKNVLLEDVPNLAANIMFSGKEPLSAGDTAEQVILELEYLGSICRHLTVVTGDIASDSLSYDTLTEDYRQALGRIGCRFASNADYVAEICAGLPNVLKDHRPL